MRAAHLLTAALFALAPLTAQAQPKQQPKPAPKLNPQFLKLIEQAAPKLATATPKARRKLLVYTYAQGFVHSSIPYGAHALQLMGQKTGAFEAVVTDDPAAFEWDSLNTYDAVCFLSTTGDCYLRKKEHYKDAQDEQMFKEREPRLQANLMKFVRGGKGWVGFHAASDCYYRWSDFGFMVGGYFWGHPWNEDVVMKLDDPAHALSRVFAGGSYGIKDEIYQFKEPYSRDRLRVLLSLDTQRTNMKKNGINRKDNDFAVSWVQAWGDGRMFYSSLGHREDVFWNPLVMEFYLDGLQYALGDLSVDQAPSSKVPSTQPSPADKLPPEALTGIKAGEPGVAALFDGKSLEHWDHKEGGWVVENGTMSLKGQAGDIWSKKRYSNFVLDLEFNMSKDCNSGVFLRVHDRQDWLNTGMEIQVLDSAGKPNPSIHDCGALYDCMAPKVNAAKPAGEWNRYVITCSGARIHAMLNGQVVLDVDLNDWKEPGKNPDGKKNKFRWAYKDMWRSGYLSFQDHGHPIQYRNVLIKELP